MNVVRRLPRLAWEALLLELAIYRALARWVVRRPDVPRGATAIHYSRLAGPMIWLWTFGSAVEVVVVDVVVSHWVPSIRIPLLVLGIWGVLWMVGLYAAYRVRPHVLTGSELVIRGGLRAQVVVPLPSIASVRTQEHELPGIVKSLHVEAEGEGRIVLLGVSSRTNLELELVGQTVVRTTSGEETAARIGLWVDDPREVRRQLQQVVGSRLS